MDHSDFLESLIALLNNNRIPYCVIGGQGVNAYVERLQSAEALLREHYQLERFPHSLNISVAGSDLRVQVWTDPRYVDFVARASRRGFAGTN